jgi:hypothetical protein
MYILRAFTFLLFLAQVVLAEQPTPILPDPKLTPGDTFDVTAQDVCVPAYAKKVRAVPAWLKRQGYAEYGITEYKTGDYVVDHFIPLSLDALIPFVTCGPINRKRLTIPTYLMAVFFDGLWECGKRRNPGAEETQHEEINRLVVEFETSGIAAGRVRNHGVAPSTLRRRLKRRLLENREALGRGGFAKECY